VEGADGVVLSRKRLIDSFHLMSELQIVRYDSLVLGRTDLVSIDDVSERSSILNRRVPV